MKKDLGAYVWSGFCADGAESNVSSTQEKRKWGFGFPVAW
jgi:hypothetical protein